MDVFQLRDDLIADYSAYTKSFMAIRDARIRHVVDDALENGKLWPNPRLGLNPAFQAGGTIDELSDGKLLVPAARDIVRSKKSDTDPIGSPMTLHQHQVDAIRAAAAGESYVLTTGTGSGKSLSYIVPIVDHVLRVGSGDGVKAIVVYPMNALASSQEEELKKFLGFGPWGSQRPVTFAKYTGQEKQDDRDRVQAEPPDILLTNYVMLELILTRLRDRQLVSGLGDLRFLVLDELHTYRGRQGADVALLVRRLREAAGSPDLLCVGTSATLSTEGSYLAFYQQPYLDKWEGHTLLRLAEHHAASPSEGAAVIDRTLALWPTAMFANRERFWPLGPRLTWPSGGSMRRPLSPCKRWRWAGRQDRLASCDTWPTSATG